MIKSQNKKHRQAEQSDKHCLVNGVENLMVDGRGKCRPFGLLKPKAAPTLEVDENGGELRRDAGYSYVYTPYDSYHNAEGEPSPATEYIKPGSDADYRTVSVGEIDPDTGEYHMNVLKVSGTNLSKVNDYYVNQCIAVLIENNDRPTPYSQWQYRKIINYEWDGADEVGVFTVSRDFLNVDADPEDQNYEVRLSDMDMEEGEVGGKSAGNRKLILDPNASTDVSSYRMKVIRIVQGVGKGQSRFIMDATLNSLGQVEITVNKPWKKKPKFVDPTKRSVQEKQSSLKTREDAKPKFFNQNWSSSYVISDPLRFNGLCFDGEVESRDKKTGRIMISGLGMLQSILTGNVIRFLQGKDGAAKIVISLENANTDIDWANEDSLVDKRLRITSGPGAGKEYVITAAEESGTNSVKLTLGVPKSSGDAASISGVPTAKSTYVVYTADAENDSELLIRGVQDGKEEPIGTEEWAAEKNEIVITDITHSAPTESGMEVITNIPAYGATLNYKEATSTTGATCWLQIDDKNNLYGDIYSQWRAGIKVSITPYAFDSEGHDEPKEPWKTSIAFLKREEQSGRVGAPGWYRYKIDLLGWPYWMINGSSTERAAGYENYRIATIGPVEIYKEYGDIAYGKDALYLSCNQLSYNPNVSLNIETIDFSKYAATANSWVGSLVNIYPYAKDGDEYQVKDPWTTKIASMEEYGAYDPSSDQNIKGYYLKLEGWPYWLQSGQDTPAEEYSNYINGPLAEAKIYNQELIGDPNKITFSSDWKGNVTITVKDPLHTLGDTGTWFGKRIDIRPMVGYMEPYEQGDPWTTTIKQGFKTDAGYTIDVDGWPYWFKKGEAKNKKQYEDYAWSNRLWSVTLWDSFTGTGSFKETIGDDLTKIYINDINSTGIYENDGQGGNKNVVNGLYTASFQVASLKQSGKKQYKATISRFIHSVGVDADGAYIELIGQLPRLYDKPRKPNDNPQDDGSVVLMPVLESPVNIYGANSRDGFYTGWRALFINTTEIGGNKQRLKCKDARVIASFDATGEIIVDKEVAGVKAGWQVVLYSEYISCFGSCVNAGERSQYYRKGKADYGIYDEFVPLEPFASSEDDEYNGWTLEVLAKGKLKKDGSTKYSKTPSRYRNKQRRTVVDYFGASRRAYVYSNDPQNAWHELSGERFNPLLKGNEFIWLYDPATSIEKLFDEESKDSVADDFGVKIKVKGIKMCPLDGVDKIRLYRANEATGAYRLVADLENKDQDYIDNIPEEHLSTEINLSHVPPPPCGKVCEFKGRFVLAGAINNSPTAFLTKGGHMASFIPDYGVGDAMPNPLVEKYLYTDGKTFTGRALRVSPAIGIFSNVHSGTVIPQRDDTNTEQIKVGLAISEVEGDGVIAWCERRQFSGVFQRSRVPVATSEEKYKAVDHVFLSTGAAGTLEAYEHSVLVFSSKDDDGSLQQTWPFYAGPDDPRYDPKTKQFTFENSQTVSVPVLSGTIYPVPFQIRTAVWVIYRKNGKYYCIDNETKTKDGIRQPREISVEENNGITFVVASVNQGETFNNFSYHIGGNAAQAVAPDLFYTGSNEGYNTTPTVQFRLIATNFGLENEDIVSCYLGADAETLTNQEPASYKPVLTIPECVENSSSASVYTDTGELIVDPTMKKAHSYNGELVWIAIWDKEYTGAALSGAVRLVARDNAKTVFCTAATDGEVEKVELAQSFVFNDGYGTDVTAVAPTNNFVAVFKQRAIYALDPDGPSVGLLMNDIGCIATDSVAMGRSGLYWMAEGRRIMRSDFEHGTEYVGAPVQPWFDGYKDFDGWYVDKDNLTDLISTYDVDHDEYIMFVPAKKGTSTRLICLCFCDQFQIWYRVEDDALHSDNKADCAFRFEGCGAYAGAKGIWVNMKKRSGYAAWLWKSIQRDEGNSGVMKHIKRIKILNVITDKEPSGTTGEPEAGFEFYKEMRTSPEGSYQASDAHTVRGVLTNRFAQLVHVGLRAFLWQFKFFGESYVKLFDFVLQYRSKGEAEADGWIDTPN